MLRKQLLYLSSEQLCAYEWRAGRLSDGQRFACDAAGRQAFGAYLAARADAAPAYLLADLIEEDFQRQLLPHVSGRGGRRLLARRLDQLYRDTPYRHAAIQGRDSAGRRDDRVLLCALTNPALVAPWVDLLAQRGTPLAGVYSASLLSALLPARLGLAARHLLLVTQQSGGLRESYFEAGQLKFSRLTPAIEHDGVTGETARMRQFLASIRLLARGDVLHTFILLPGAQGAALRPLCLDSAEIAYHFIEMETAAARLGLAAAPAKADQLLLSLLGRQAPASHYRLAAASRFYRLWRLRRALHAGSAALLAGAVLWLAVNLWGIAAALSASARLEAETRAFDARYHASMAALPAPPEPTRNMKAAVLLERMTAANAPGPAPLLALLAAALDNAPQVALVALDWQVRAAPLSALQIGAPAAPPQVLRVEAELMLGQNDYHGALAAMQQLTQALARQPHLSVQVAQAPFDLRPGAKLSGRAGAGPADGRATFVLNLLWQP